MNTQAISLTMFVLGLFSMFGTRLGGYGADRWGIPKTALYSLVIHALALLLLPLAQLTVVMTVIIMAIWVGSAWMTSPTLQAYFIQQMPHSPDLSLSLNTSILQIGFAIGAGLVGLVVNFTGTVITAPMVGGSIVILGVIAAFISFRLKTSSQ